MADDEDGFPGGGVWQLVWKDLEREFDAGELLTPIRVAETVDRVGTPDDAVEFLEHYERRNLIERVGANEWVMK